MRLFVFAFAGLAACCLSSIAVAQAPRVEGKRLTSLPTIDGTVDEAEWAGAAHFEGLIDANDGTPAAERSRFWLGYDDDFVYFAAKLYDPQPGTIKATEYRTNVDMPGDDMVELSLDLSGSMSDFNDFEINPRGATNIELAGGRAAKREWTGEFVAKSRITSEGWETEARIPWQAMSIPAGGKRDVRFNVGRFIPRTSRFSQHGYTNNGQMANTPIWLNVDLPKPAVDRSIKLLPYLYTGYDEDEKTVFNSGLDLKTQLADQVTLVGSINPDFRNIENAILSLDFSRFERIAAESRPFFLEGRDYMESQIYASQRIGAFDVGVNTYGKLSDKLQFGLINALDFGHENAFASNFTYSPDADTNYRLTATNLTNDFLDNSAYLLRASRQMGNVNASVRTLGSFDSKNGYGADHDATLNYHRNGFSLWTGYEYVEPDFRPALGFVPETDYKGFNAGLASVRRFKRTGIQTHGFQVYGMKYDHVDGDPYRDDINLDTFMVFRNQLFVQVNADYATFEGSKDTIYTASLGYPNNDPYREQTLSIQKGTIGGEDYNLLSYRGNFRPLKGFQISASHQLFELGRTIQQTILGLNYDLGNDRSISGRAVRFDDSTNWYLAFRQSGNRGAEYYLILGDPNAREFRQSVVLKAVFPFQLGSSRSTGQKRQLSP